MTYRVTQCNAQGFEMFIYYADDRNQLAYLLAEMACVILDGDSLRIDEV